MKISLLDAALLVLAGALAYVIYQRAQQAQQSQPRAYYA